MDWNDYPRIRQIAAVLRQQDILYHDIDPRHSLFYQSAEPFLLIEDEHEIETARQSPPGDTRAAVRSHAIRLAAERHLDIILDWHQIHMGGSNTTISLPDPLSSDSTVLQKIFPGSFPTRLPPARPIHPRPQDSSADEITIDILSIENLDPPTAKE